MGGVAQMVVTYSVQYVWRLSCEGTLLCNEKYVELQLLLALPKCCNFRPLNVLYSKSVTSDEFICEWTFERVTKSFFKGSQ
jgi:hypothetical protein